MPVAALASATLVGCTNGCSQERPYTPYAVEAGEALFAKDAETAADAEAETPVALALAADAGRGFAQKPEAASATRWSLDGLELIAPPDQSFVVGLASDLDGDGQKDAVAWVVPSDPAVGRLLFYRGRAGGELAAPKPLTELARIFPEGCTPEVSLEQVGSTTVAVQANASCPEPLPPGATSRWIGVVSPSAEPSLRQGITVREPHPGEQLSIAVDASDRDGDGRDDLAVRVALEGGSPPFEPGPKTTAELRWFDRPAGLSRDADEPEASLRPYATRQMVRAERKKEAASVRAGTRQLMRLYAALCEEAGAQLVTLSTGPLRCGTSRALEDAVLAQIRAENTLGEPLRALAAGARFSDWPTSQTSGRRKEADRILRKLAPPVPAGPSRVLEANPVRWAGPSWSPLSFDSDGVLLVSTYDGVVKATAYGEEWLVDDIEPWPLTVTSDDGQRRWASSFDPCDGLAYKLRIASAEGVMDESILPLLSPASGRKRCAGDVASTAIGRSKSGIQAIVAGEPWLLKLDAGSFEAKPLGELSSSNRVRGSAWSPDGSALAVATRDGVLVRSAGKWRLWQLEGAAPLEKCTAANQAQAIACLRGGKVVLARAPSEAGK